MRNERSERVRVFLEEIADVCRRHRLSISHEDGHGAFIVETLKQDNIDWLNHAAEDIDETVQP